MPYHCTAHFDVQKLGHDEHYFAERETWLDTRGALQVHSTANFGFQVMVMTTSHDVSKGGFTVPIASRPVTVQANAWIGSRAILYNCIIEEGAIVALGAVVRNVIVPKLCMVEGNPVRIIKRWSPDEKIWVHEDSPCPPMTFK